MARKVEQVKLVVTPEEKLQIQNNAKAAGRTTGAYIRAMALNLCILECLPYDIVDAHTKEISSLRNAINQLIYTIMKMGDYYPAYLEDIHSLMMEIMESEKKLLEMTADDVEKKQKIFKQQVKKTVNARLKEAEAKKKR